MRLEPAIPAILARLPDIKPARGYQIANALRATGAIVTIGRRLHAIPDRLDAVLERGLPIVSGEPRPAA